MEAFEGIVRFNPWLLFLDVSIFIWYVTGWYKQYKRTGAYIDYWRFNMFLVFLLPVIIMYPFSGSSLNIFAVLGADNLYVIQENVDKAYIITLWGFAGVYIGKTTFDRCRFFKGVELIIKPFYSTLGRFFVSVAKSTLLIRLFTTIYIMVLIGFVYFTATSGLLRNPREFFKLNTQYAPIYTLILSTFEFVFLVLSARVIQFSRRVDIVLFLTLILFGFFLGVRAPVILQGLSFGVLYTLYKYKGYVSPIKILGVVAVTLIIVMSLSFIRNSSDTDSINFNNAALSFLPEVFYGNTFSDIRDFSWVLGYWDGDLYWGLSYIAAFFSFIPSSIFPIRETYGIGKITVRAAGLDTITHPGLRMGIFGEMYINFGLLGVVIFGFLWGYIQRRLSILTKHYAFDKNAIKANSVILYSSFVSYLTVSAGFWNFYISTFLLIVLFFVSRIKTYKSF